MLGKEIACAIISRHLYIATPVHKKTGQPKADKCMNTSFRTVRRLRNFGITLNNIF